MSLSGQKNESRATKKIKRRKCVTDDIKSGTVWRLWIGLEEEVLETGELPGGGHADRS